MNRVIDTGTDTVRIEVVDRLGASRSVGREAVAALQARRSAVTWAFDVDGTLIGSIRSDRLRPGAAELLTELVARGQTLVLWSAGGAAYAERMARAHGIAQHFTAFYAKDERGVDARYLVDHFHPSHRPTRFVDDSPIDLPLDIAIVAVPQFLGGNSADQALWQLIAALDDHVGDGG